MDVVLAILLGLGCGLSLPIYAWLVSAPFTWFLRERNAGKPGPRQVS